MDALWEGSDPEPLFGPALSFCTASPRSAYSAARQGDETGQLRIAPGTQPAPAVPLVVDAPHEQGAVELHGPGGEQGPVRKEARFRLLDGQGLHLPVEAPQLQ